MLFSVASFRTSGVTYGAPSESEPWACAAGWDGSAFGAGAGSGLGCGLGSGAGRAWRRAAVGPRPWAAGAGSGLGSGLGAGGGGRPRRRTAPIWASSPPTGTVASSSAVMLSRTPATGDGISVSTLSVDTSTSGSSTWTESPTFLSQRVTVPSVTDSPSSGISTGVALPPPVGAAVLRVRAGARAPAGPRARVPAGPRERAPAPARIRRQVGSAPARALSERAAFDGVADDGQLAADLDGVVLLGDDLGQHTRGGRGDFGVDLVGRHFNERLVEFDRVAFLLEPAGDRPLGDALTECRHLDGEGHLF